jgi:mannosyltransferase OCH1-like enzyme
MIPKILHQCKTRPHLSYSWEERRLATRAQKLMPGWEYHAWNDEDNLALLELICPAYVKEYLEFPNGAIRSDIVRYLYMYQYGGIYFDTDFYFYKPLNEELLSHVCILGIEEEDMPELGGGPKLGNAFIGSQPHLSLWEELVDDIFQRFRKGETLYAWQLSGPYALTSFLKDHDQYRESVTILPRNVVYPPRTSLFLRSARDRETIGVHLMWGSWRDMSLLHKVKNRTERILSAAIA